MDFQDLATGLAGVGGGGGMEGSEGVWHTTVVPSHFQLRSYGPEHVVHLCACFVVVVFCLVFDLFLFFNALVQI